MASGTHAADHKVTITGFAFEPANISEAAGDTITFINEDAAPHTGMAFDGSFETGRLNKGDSATVTIGSAGTFDYKCAFHPSMTASVTAK